MLSHISSQQWREDLSYLVDGLRREHRNPFHTTSPEALGRSASALHGRIPSLSSHEIIVELARLVALIGDGHTTLRLADVAGFRHYPINLYQFEDGLFVQSIDREHASAAGSRLIAIDGIPASEAYEAMRSLISHDNGMGIIAQAPRYLTIPEVLHACGVTTGQEGAVFTIQRYDGEMPALHLTPTPTLPSDMANAYDDAKQPIPLWLQHPEKNWHQHLPEHQALYVAYNRVRDSPEESLEAFFDRIFAVIQKESVERLIVDIRLNGGGNNLLNRPFIHHLIRSDRINQWGSLFAIIGRQTFSAAMNFAVDLERHTRVLFVGEPTAASPNHYGENGLIVLPHSELRVSVSKLWWQSSDPYDDRPWITPDIPARLGSGHYAEHTDPALDAALAYVPTSPLPLDFPDRLFSQLRLNHSIPTAT